MAYGFGFGRGFGFRGSSPPWPYVGRGRGGLPRCWYFGPPVVPSYAPGGMAYPQYGGFWGEPYYAAPGVYGPAPYVPQMSREEELGFLREEAKTIKAQLDEIEARMKSLESE
jgi:hypothetical protein